MKITKSKLKEIIKEEYNRAMREGSLLDDPDEKLGEAAQRIPRPEAGEARVSVPVSAMNKFKKEMEAINMFYDKAYTIAHEVNIGPKVNANYFREEGNEQDQFMHLTPKSSKELTRVMREIDKALGRVFDTYGMKRKYYREEKYASSKQFDAEHALRDVGAQEE